MDAEPFTPDPADPSDPFGLDDVPAFTGKYKEVDRKKIKMTSTGPKPKKTDLEAKTRDLLERNGRHYDRTEQTIPFTGRKRDTFGCVDGIAISSDGHVVFVQTCAKSDLSAHMRKIATGTHSKGSKKFSNIEALRPVLSGASPGASYVIFAWHQPNGKGTKWEYDEIQVTLEMLAVCVERAAKRKARKGAAK